MKLRAIVNKNLLLVLRSRLWMLVIILAPLLLIFLTSLAFDNFQSYKINIAVYSEDYGVLTTSYLTKLNTNQFRTIKAGSEASCLDAVKIGRAHTCLIVSPELALGSENNDLTIYIDYSKLNLAWIIRDQLYTTVDERSGEISEELTENILSALLVTRDAVAKDRELLAVVSDFEQTIENSSAHVQISYANVSSLANQSVLDTLSSRVSSLRATSQDTFDDTRRYLDFTDIIINRGEFEDNEYDQYKEVVRDQRTDLRGNQNYVETLFDIDNPTSINNSILELRTRISSLEKTLARSEQLAEEVHELSAANNKILRRMTFSMENVFKTLENIDQYEASDIAQPISAHIQPLSAYNSNFNFIYPTLLALAIMLAALLLSSIVVVMDINSPAHFRNVISPTGPVFFYLGRFSTNFLIIAVQIALMLVFAMIFFFNQIIANLFTTILVSAIIAMFFVILGMSIGHIFRREHMAILAATFTASVLMFLSNLLIPIENMPEQLAAIVQFNPFIIAVSLLRKSILFEQPLPLLWPELQVLLLITAFMVVNYFILHAYVRRNLRTMSANT